MAITLKTKGGLEYLSFDDLYNKLRTLEIDVKGCSSYDSRVKTKDEVNNRVAARIDKKEGQCYKCSEIGGRHEGGDEEKVCAQVFRDCGDDDDTTSDASGDVSDVAAEFALMGLSSQVKLEESKARFNKWKESSKNLDKLINSSMSSRSNCLDWRNFWIDEVFDLSALDLGHKPGLISLRIGDQLDLPLCFSTGSRNRPESVSAGRQFSLVGRSHAASFNLTEIQPERDLTCLLGKASSDESTKWHRRMAHVNFKNINKLAKHGLVNGLPSKLFTNDHNCVACNKGRQHKASYKAIYQCELHFMSLSWLLSHGFLVLLLSEALITSTSLVDTVVLSSDNCKFEGKADEGFIVGYAAHSKAYRVYNLSNKKIEETLNLRYLEDKPNVQSLGQECIVPVLIVTMIVAIDPAASISAGSIAPAASISAGSAEPNFFVIATWYGSLYTCQMDILLWDKMDLRTKEMRGIVVRIKANWGAHSYQYYALAFASLWVYGVFISIGYDECIPFWGNGEDSLCYTTLWDLKIFFPKQGLHVWKACWSSSSTKGLVDLFLGLQRMPGVMNLSVDERRIEMSCIWGVPVASTQRFPFVLEAYSVSDYAGYMVDRKSTMVDVSSMGRRYSWIQNQMLDYGVQFMIKNIVIDFQNVSFMRVVSHVSSVIHGQCVLLLMIQNSKKIWLVKYVSSGGAEFLLVALMVLLVNTLPTSYVGIEDLPIADIYLGMDTLGYPTEGKLTFYKNKFSPQWRKRISHKRTKNQSKRDKTGRGMEKGVKAKPNQSQVYSEKKKQRKI
ncbi:ribonuclease H-like domain-containing protein [Tanacetum coccineum]